MKIKTASRIILSGLALLLLMQACQQPKLSDAPLFIFMDSSSTGIAFNNLLPEEEKFNILDYLYFYNGGGVAAGDINNDGLPDLYFVSNQGKNKLYLNKGNFQFEDISKKAGVEGFADWQTGVTMADVNGDGLLDIYVCAVGNFKGLEGANELYINNGDLTFSEKAAEYDLDFTGFSTQAAFFDYDKDGDLDMYLLNHAVHTSRSYDRVAARNLRNNEAGDRLYRNDGKRFTDVSEASGIFGPAMGYGLGLAVADLNGDGWDDIYVGNDFHEDDYYYINNRNGTFTESIKKHFGHTSRFSMGCDIADLNNDGFPEIITLDMYPDDEVVEKMSTGEDPLDIFTFKLDYGYFYQYSRNCLQLNHYGRKFSDIALMAGVAATDWSWAPLLADYDNDGLKDLFISNGIVRRPNNLDYIKYVSSDSIRYLLATTKLRDYHSIQMMPEGAVHNYIFKGTDSLRFSDRSTEWGFTEAGFSNGAVYVDLDGDGDLDLVTNNINAPAGIFRNQSKELGTGQNHLRIRLEGSGQNTFALGAKVAVKTASKTQWLQLMPTRGFLSSVEPVLHFGLGAAQVADSVYIQWPDLRVQILTNVQANQVLRITQQNAVLSETAMPPLLPQAEVLLKDSEIPSLAGWTHQENAFYDFNREALMPFTVSAEGPALAIADVNGDGWDDIFVGGAKHQPSALFLQSSNRTFVPSNQALWAADSVYEDVDAVFFDANGDGFPDLYVASAGNEFYGDMEQMHDRLYLNDGQGNFRRAPLPSMFTHSSCVRPYDVDGDGDLDLFIGGRVVSFGYGQVPDSYLLINDGKGNFSDQTLQKAPELRQIGMVTDAAWADLDGNGKAELVVSTEWGGIHTFAIQADQSLKAVSSIGTSLLGLWQSLAIADVNGDGKPDIIAGNMGLNTKLIKDPNPQLRMWVKDIDGNGSVEQIIAYNRGNSFFPIASKDELGKQMPAIINKKFTRYEMFAGKPIDQIFSKNSLSDAKLYEVNTFASLWLENTGNLNFVPRTLPPDAQWSRLNAFFTGDINGDGISDILAGGNFNGASMYQGRYDASYGHIWLGSPDGRLKSLPTVLYGFLTEGEVKHIRSLRTAQGSYIVVARNRAPLQFFKFSEPKPL